MFFLMRDWFLDNVEVLLLRPLRALALEADLTIDVCSGALVRFMVSRKKEKGRREKEFCLKRLEKCFFSTP